MEVIILILVLIAALCVVGSGVWVAIALVNAISAYRNQINKENSDHTDNKNI